MIDYDDVVQVALIAAWQGPKRLTMQQRKAHMRYSVVNELRKYLNHPEYPLEWETDLAHYDRSETIEADEVEDLGRIIAQLPDMEYVAVCLKLMSRHPIRAVINEKWLRPQEMSQVLPLARKRLRKLLKERAWREAEQASRTYAMSLATAVAK